MSAPAVIIIGAGGHAVVVADALLASGAQVLGFTDVDSNRHGQEICGLPVLGGDAVLNGHNRAAVVLANGVGGIGRVTAELPRRIVQQRFGEQGWRFIRVVHPNAIVSPFAQLGEGVQALAGSVIQPGARLGEGCIVNTRAVVEHDAVLGDFTHVAPGAVVCGDVTLGADCHIGAGAVVRQGLRLGEATVVGMGSVVVKDCSGHCVLVGVPARQLERRQ
jgi:sugar O-acyltransferase (sialic acid O-acetyltransferase NeuD family)